MFGPSLFGLPVHECSLMTVTRSYWVFPERRFVEYGPEDESWARAAGFGHEVVETVPSPEMVRVGDAVYGHPDTLAKAFAHFRRMDAIRQQTLELPGREPFKNYVTVEW